MSLGLKTRIQVLHKRMWSPWRRSLITKRSGFTMVEVLVASSLFALIALAVFAYMERSQRAFYEEGKVIEVQRTANHLLQTMIKGADGVGGIMSASAVSLISSTQLNYTSSGGDACSFWLGNADADLSTLSDNILWFDPDTSVSSNEVNLSTNIGALNFSVNNNVVSLSVTVSAQQEDNVYSHTASTDVLMRNA